MEAKKFNDLISMGRLQLTFSEKFTHYLIVIVFTGLSLMGLSFMIVSNNAASFERAQYVFIFCFSITIIFYFIQKRRLRFVVIETILNKEQLGEVIDYVAKRQKWKKKTRSKTFYVATCNDDWFLSNGTLWGERITIAYDNHKIYFNSICDPKKRATITAWTRNWHHASIFKRAVRLLEEDIKSKNPTI